MAHAYAPAYDHDEERVHVPMDAFTFEGFQRWMESDEFPESGRIDFLAGKVEVDLSPEDAKSHSVVKVAISTGLQIVVSHANLGEVYSDSTRLIHPQAGLSTEPDVMVVFSETFERGRVRYVPGSSNPDLTPALEGSPDLVVEVMSFSSVRKDTEVLRRLYARAGIPEYWLADARVGLHHFQILTLQEGEYVAVPPDPDGWTPSPRLGLRFRLVRHRTPHGSWRYVLEHRDLDQR